VPFAASRPGMTSAPSFAMQQKGRVWAKQGCEVALADVNDQQACSTHSKY